MNNENKSKSNIVIAIIVIILLLGFIGNCGSCSSSGGSSETCKSCYKTFTNSDDVSSIVWTNMCENCYSNYKWTKDALDGYKKYEENN